MNALRSPLLRDDRLVSVLPQGRRAGRFDSKLELTGVPSLEKIGLGGRRLRQLAAIILTRGQRR